MRILPMSCAMLLAGCASLPNVDVAYRLPKAISTLKVTETYACNETKDDYLVVVSPSLSTSYVADHDSAVQKVDLKALDGPVTSTTFNMGFTDDGRLKSVNAAGTGNGSEILTALGAVVTGFRTFANVAAAPPAVLPICSAITRYGDPKLGTLTLTRQATVDHIKREISVFEPDAASKLLYAAIEPTAVLGAGRKVFNELSIEPVKYGEAQAPRVQYKGEIRDSGGADVPTLVMRAVRVDQLTLVSKKLTGGSSEAVNFKATVPDLKEYRLPLPRAVLFGQNSLVLTVSDAGEITSVTYGAVSGTAAALDAVNKVNGMANPSVIQLAAEEKARADLIYQQERLAACLAKNTPSTCKS